MRKVRVHERLLAPRGPAPGFFWRVLVHCFQQRAGSRLRYLPVGLDGAAGRTTDDTYVLQLQSIASKLRTR